MDHRTIGRVALLSIHPRHAEAILSGDKRVELRRSPISPDTTHVLIYATSPVRKIVGWFEVKGIDVASKTSIWERYKRVAGISRSEHRSYFAGAPRAFAIKIDRVGRLNPELEITDLPDVRTPPQSFRYVDAVRVSWMFNPTD